MTKTATDATSALSQCDAHCAAEVGLVYVGISRIDLTSFSCMCFKHATTNLLIGERDWNNDKMDARKSFD